MEKYAPVFARIHSPRFQRGILVLGLAALAPLVVSGSAAAQISDSLRSAVIKAPGIGGNGTEATIGWTTVLAKGSTSVQVASPVGTPAGRVLVLGSFEMQGPGGGGTNRVQGNYRLRCSNCSVLNQVSQPITLSVNFLNDSLNQGGVAWIFDQLAGGATYFLEHKIGALSTPGATFNSGSATVVVVPLTTVGNAALVNSLDTFGTTRTKVADTIPDESPAAMISLTRAAALATGTVSGLHGFTVGDRIFIRGATDTDRWNGYFTVTATPTTSTFEFNIVGTLPTLTTAAGSLFVARSKRAVAVGGLTQSGATVTLTTVQDHGLIPGDHIAVSGANDEKYNDDFLVLTVPTLNSLTYVAFSGAPTPDPNSNTLGLVQVRKSAQKVNSLSAVGRLVTVTTASSHGLIAGELIEISGLTNLRTSTEYKYYQGFFKVVGVGVPNANSFRYEAIEPPGNGPVGDFVMRKLSNSLDEGEFLVKNDVRGQYLETGVQIYNYPQYRKDVFLAFVATTGQVDPAPFSAWRYGNYQIYHQTPSESAANIWRPVTQIYRKTADRTLVGSVPDDQPVMLYGKITALEPGTHRFRIKTTMRNGGNGVAVHNGTFIAVSMSFQNGFFRVLKASGAGYGKPANNIQWVDNDYPLNPFRTEPFSRTGSANYVAVSSAFTWATKSGGAAVVTYGVGMRTANWTTSSGSDAWGNKLPASTNNVVVVKRDYNGSIGENCLDAGILRGCESGGQSSVGYAQFPANPLGTGPWEGSMSGQLNGQQGAMNGDLVIFETSSDVPTWAAIDSFRDASAGGPPVLSWRTSAELGTAGFRLERRAADGQGSPWKQIGGFVPAMPPSPEGAAYQVDDPDAEPGATYEYRLVEEETNGFTLPADTFKVTFTNAKKSTGRATYVRTPNVPTGPPVDRPHPSTVNLPRARMSWKALVNDEGIYAIPATPDSTIGTSRNRSMSNLGREVSYANDGKASRLLFFGKALRNLHTNKNAYLIQPGTPRFMREINGKAPAAASQPNSFRSVARYEEDVVVGTGLVFDASQDFWFWRAFQAEVPSLSTFDFPIDVPLADTTGGPVTLSFRIHGASDGPAPIDYHLRASINGAAAGEIRLGGAGPLTGTVTFDASLLRPGANSLRVEAVLAPGSSRSWFYVNGIEIAYPKLFRALGNEARVLPHAGQKTVTVSGFTVADILVFDVTDPNEPAWIKAVNVAGNGKSGPYAATFEVPAGGSDFIVVGEDRVRTASVEALVEMGLATRTAGAEHVIVAPYDLYEAAQSLASYRSSQGLSSTVVPLEAVWDEFGYGLPSPEALRSFFESATTRWSPAARFAVLAGRGTYDERNLRGYNDCLIPTFFVATPRGLVGSDGPYEGGSDLVVGRIPVTTGPALRAHVEKIIRHESSSPRQSVTIAADNPDGGGDFVASANAVAAAVPGDFEVRKAYLGQRTLAEVRQSVFDAFQRGDEILGWIGHSGSDRLASEGVLTSKDVAGLPASDRLPILVGATCFANASYLPGVPLIAERLVTRSDGGVAVSWAPVGVTYNIASSAVAKTFVEKALAPGQTGLRVGDVVVATREALPQDIYDMDALGLYQVLGDPACYVK